MISEREYNEVLNTAYTMSLQGATPQEMTTKVMDMLKGKSNRDINAICIMMLIQLNLKIK